MAWYRRWLSVGMVSMSGLLLGGCASQLPEWAQYRHSPSLDLTSGGTMRAQMADPPKSVQIATPRPLDIAPPQPIESISTRPTIEQTSLSSRGTVRVRVRAWVNGRPIFENEVMQTAGRALALMPKGLSSAEQSRKMTEIVNSAIDQLIDSELIYQDAVKKLEKVNPSALDRLREYVELEFDKRLQFMRENKVPESDIREMEPAARRIMERDLIASEYARSRIKPIVETRIGLMEVREYYESHLSEFQSEDRITWQDIFIPLSANHPTIEDLKRFGEDLINRCLKEDDFNKLIIYDGLGKNGEGLGQRKGEIQPAELESILFSLEPGKIGPVVPFPTGVHLIRVTKREYKGQLPLNDEVAKVIRKKLEKEIADREYRRLVRELRARAVWRIESES